MAFALGNSPGHAAAASKYGPRIHYQMNIYGFSPKQLVHVGVRAVGFGGAAVVGLLFFASGIPRLQNDVLKKIPGLASQYERNIHPQDNPF